MTTFFVILMTTPASPSRMPRTSRDEGMEHMVTAAVELLREQPPEAVTVRDVGRRAGHHHRFVAAWFGGKSGLFLAAFDRLALEAASAMGFPAIRTSIAPEVIRVARLMNWLVANDPSAFAHRRATPIIDRVARIYEDLGLGSELARLAAQRVVAGAISLALFPDPLGIEPDDVGRHVELEMRVAMLLKDSVDQPGADPPAKAQG
jgi:AcrR family transcriptional regulator